MKKHNKPRQTKFRRTVATSLRKTMRNCTLDKSCFKCKEWSHLGVSRYTGIDDNRDIQSNNYQYCVNLVCDDIPVLAITAIFKMNRTLMITPHVMSMSPRFL